MMNLGIVCITRFEVDDGVCMTDGSDVKTAALLEVLVDRTLL